MRMFAATLALFICLAPTLADEAMSPDEWLDLANQQFQSGDISAARTSALIVLDLGQKRSNPDWIGGSLTVLCRTALADGNIDALRKYTAELQGLINATGDQRWAGTVEEMTRAIPPSET